MGIARETRRTRFPFVDRYTLTLAQVIGYTIVGVRCLPIVARMIAANIE